MLEPALRRTGESGAGVRAQGNGGQWLPGDHLGAPPNARFGSLLRALHSDPLLPVELSRMLIAQADPGWDLSDGTRAPLRDLKTLAETDGPPDGFQEYLLALRAEVIAFRKALSINKGDN